MIIGSKEMSSRVAMAVMPMVLKEYWTSRPVDSLVVLLGAAAVIVAKRVAEISSSSLVVVKAMMFGLVDWGGAELVLLERDLFRV